MPSCAEPSSRAIAQCDGNIPKASALQINRSTLYRGIQAWQADLA